MGKESQTTPENQVHAEPKMQQEIKVVQNAPLQVQSAPLQIQQNAQQIAPTAMQNLVQTQNQQVNIALNAHAQQQIPAVAAQVTAPGAPVQEQAPPKLSYKERKKEEKKAKKARKLCPVGDAATYDMVEQLEERAAVKDNSLAGHRKELDESGVDQRVMWAFLKGYRKNRRGRPASPEDQARKEHDDAFLADYCSNDLQRRKPHLDRMVTEFLSFEVSPVMFTKEYLRRNMGHVKEISSKMLCMNNIEEDPINRPYFDALPEVKKEQLRAKFDLYREFTGALVTVSGKYGVKFNNNTYFGHDSISAIRNYNEMSQQFTTDFNTAMQTHQQEMAEIQTRENARARVAERANTLEQHQAEVNSVAGLSAVEIREAAEDYAMRMHAQQATLNRLKTSDALDVTEEEKHSVYLTRAVMLMVPGEEHDAENLDTLNLLAKMQRVGSTRPDEELYGNAREKLRPLVQKVLDCDVEAWKGLSNEELVRRMGAINELYMDNMFVADLMKMAHPTQSAATGTPLTLKDDLVGQREAEFSYKISTLRALAEKTRALALLAQSQAGGELDETFFTDAEYHRLQQSPTAYAASRLKVSERGFQTAKSQYDKLRTPGTPEFKAWVQALVQKNPAKLVIPGGKFRAVIDEFNNGATPEAAQAMKRLQKQHYYTLNRSQAELKEMGLPNEIGEAIFRSFESFQRLEATQTLLTPEQYRQMLLDLGAGADMHNGEWEDHVQEKVVDAQGEVKTVTKTVISPGTPEEELRPALEQNVRGLETYKMVVRAQMDMITRKYGNILEKLPIQELITHYTDIARDFSDAQVAINMATKHPDFLDLSKPEDQLLRKRIEYYSLFGKLALDQINFMYMGMVNTDEELAGAMSIALGDKACQQAKEFLQESDSAFQHQLDWSQKVQAPA